jgi:hypothetical protein
MLNEQQIALYQRNGFVNGGPVIEEDLLETLRTGALSQSFQQ